MRISRWLLLPVLSVAAAACSGSTTSAGLITVAGEPNLPMVTQLRLKLAAGAGDKTVTFPATDAGPLTLPKTVSVTFPKTAAGPLTADVDGLSGGTVVAHGTGSMSVSKSGTTTLTVTLTRLAVVDAGGMDAGPDMVMVSDMTPLPDFRLPDLIPPPDLSLPPDMVPPILNLATGWMQTSDDGSNAPNPQVTLSATSFTSATIKSTGGPSCGCNAQTIDLPLGKTLTCASATLEFNYTTSGNFGTTNKSSIFVQFFNGVSSAGLLFASEQVGNSKCAAFFAGSNFPSPPQLNEGLNKISLGALMPSLNGSCGSSFNRIVLHVQAYGCLSTETSTSTISDLRVY